MLCLIIQDGQGPCQIISPELKVGGELQEKASNGNTNVFMNKREITKKERWLLKVVIICYRYNGFLTMLKHSVFVHLLYRQLEWHVKESLAFGWMLMGHTERRDRGRSRGAYGTRWLLHRWLFPCLVFLVILIREKPYFSPRQIDWLII